MNVLLLCAFLGSAGAYRTLENRILGQPRIACSHETVTMDMETQNNFQGRIFVKGKSADKSCYKDFSKNTATFSAYNIQLGLCGMQRLRSVTPRGMNFMVTVIVSFHPRFITAADHAYNIKCFYMEPEENVSVQIGVSDLPSVALEDSTAMPSCSYTVRSGSPEGPPAEFARVGDTVFHVWACEGGRGVGMMVKRCAVKDAEGEEYNVVDYSGCATDPLLLSQLHYEADLTKAWAKSRVFKYADQSSLYFQCQIRLCQKSLGLCLGLSPPSCGRPAVSEEIPSGNYSSSHYRARRDLQLRIHPTSRSRLELDVASPSLTVLDLTTSAPAEANATTSWDEAEGRTAVASVDAGWWEEVCISPLGLVGLALLWLVIGVAALGGVAALRPSLTKRF